MSSRALLADIRALQEQIVRAAETIAGVRSFAKHWINLIEVLVQLPEAKNAPKQAELTAAARDAVAKAQKDINSWPPSSSFRDLHGLQSVLADMTAEPAASVLGVPLRQAVEDFHAKYDSYLLARTIQATVKVLRSADSLAIALDSLDFLGRQVDHYLRSEIQIPEGNAALELVIEASLSFDDVVDKLEALRGLYSLTADLLSVDTREFPPLARRLEAGSLWMNIVVSSHNVGTS